MMRRNLLEGHQGTQAFPSVPSLPSLPSPPAQASRPFFNSISNTCANTLFDRGPMSGQGTLLCVYTWLTGELQFCIFKFV